LIAPNVAGWLALEAPGIWRAPRLSRVALEGVASRRLRRLLRDARQVPFYSERLKALDPTLAPLEVLHSFPPVGKEALRAAADTGLRGGRLDPSWFSSRSSGSTGEPFRVHYDARAWAILKYLVKARARWLNGVRPWHRIAIIDAPADAGVSPAAAQHGRVRMISALQPAEAIAAALRVFAPDVIDGLPSVLCEALEVLGGALRVPRIFSNGELLSPGVRSLLEGGFGGRVFDVYGSTETKEVAWECRQHRLHVNTDVLHVEVLDESGQPVDRGEEGVITVTVLVNHAMPLLRYQPGDRGRWLPGECSCGLTFPVFGVVTGREVEYLDLGDGVRLSPYHLTCAIERAHGIGRYRVVQQAARCLEVEVMALPGADPETIRRQVCDEVGAAAPVPLEVRVRLTRTLPSGEGRKYRVVQHLPRES
jgi:phenylacetate-CoA ligase